MSSKADEKLRKALREILVMGALDLDATLNYRDVLMIFARHGVPFSGTNEEYTMLEQAARNAMFERQAHGCMIWGVGIDEFVEEYLKLKEADA